MRKFLLLPCLLVSQSLLANEMLWTDIDPIYQQRQSNSTATFQGFQNERRLKLDLSKLEQLLDGALSQQGEAKYLELPMPDGRQMQFVIEPSAVMAPALAKRYPQIKTWKIYNPSNPAINGRIDLTPKGFHGLINTDKGERVFIDPEGDSSLNRYVSRNSHPAHAEDSNFNCKLHSDSSVLLPKQSPLQMANRLASRAADSFRTYRIAIATTGEYTQLFGGSKSDALASVVTTVNRLNQVFERDLSVHLELVEDNDKILYTSSTSDPYTNEDASAMVDENIVNVNDVIGSDNYDIGHVFGTGNTGGLAFLNSACGTYKAGGVTGSNTPSGEAFNIDYVAHEIGHQLGASHTFNGHKLNCSAGNREGETAVEPGSGSSIMGYAGICGTDNLQSNSDAFFHSVSINQIKNYTRNSTGSNCGTLNLQNNDDPTVSAGNNYTIPAETPFKLTGTTTDNDADSLIHSWEQVDTGSTGGLHSDLGDNPLFRTWPPTSSPSRFFPRLVDILNNTTTIGELLPTTDRTMEFTLLARDNKGGVSQDNTIITTVNTGNPFAVLSQDTSTTLSTNQSITVTWDVANTTLPPISCSHVNIGLIDQSGITTSLISNTPNDGSQALNIPTNIISMQNAHIHISCVGNVFFAVSKGEIELLGGHPMLSVNSPTINEQDSGVSNLTFVLSLSAPAAENIAIIYEVSDAASSAIVKSGTLVIAQGTSSANIDVPITGDTVHESNQVLNISLQKPLNAQFANQSNELNSQGTVIDDDLALGPIAANPEPESQTPVSTSSGGGGSFNLFSILGLLLLSLRRKYC